MLIITKISQNFTNPFRNAMFSKIIAQTYDFAKNFALKGVWKGCLSQRLANSPSIRISQLWQKFQQNGPTFVTTFCWKDHFFAKLSTKTALLLNIFLVSIFVVTGNVFKKIWLTFLDGPEHLLAVLGSWLLPKTQWVC